MNIVAYTGGWCGPSTMLRIAFKKQDIKYTNIDVTGNLKETKDAGVVATPTIVLTNQKGTEVRLIGYDIVVLKRVQDLLLEEENV